MPDTTEVSNEDLSQVAADGVNCIHVSFLVFRDISTEALSQEHVDREEMFRPMTGDVHTVSVSGDARDQVVPAGQSPVQATDVTGTATLNGPHGFAYGDFSLHSREHTYGLDGIPGIVRVADRSGPSLGSCGRRFPFVPWPS